MPFLALSTLLGPERWIDLLVQDLRILDILLLCIKEVDAHRHGHSVVHRVVAKVRLMHVGDHFVRYFVLHKFSFWNV